MAFPWQPHPIDTRRLVAVLKTSSWSLFLQPFQTRSRTLPSVVDNQEGKASTKESSIVENKADSFLCDFD